MATYENSEGKIVDIEKMADAHLLNAFNKYKKRVALLEKDVHTGGGNKWYWDYLSRLRQTIKDLGEEVQKRGLQTL